MIQDISLWIGRHCCKRSMCLRTLFGIVCDVVCGSREQGLYDLLETVQCDDGYSIECGKQG